MRSALLCCYLQHNTTSKMSRDPATDRCFGSAGLITASDKQFIYVGFGTWSKVVHASMPFGEIIIGENRIISVIENAVEAGVSAVNAAFGDHTELSCTPLRCYEGFAEHCLGVDKTLTEPSSRRLGNDGRLFWVTFNVEYEGLSFPDLLSTWKTGATAVLNLRASGKMELDLFKVVGQRNVCLFIKCPDHEMMDDILFNLPIMKDLGNQIHIVTKSIVALEVSISSIQD